MAERGQPILSLVSRVFLRDRERIIDQLTHTGHADLLYYMLQQIQQFRKFGEDFAMQHKDSEYLGEVEEELQMAVLEAIPAERYARRLRKRRTMNCRRQCWRRFRRKSVCADCRRRRCLAA